MSRLFVFVLGVLLCLSCSKEPPPLAPASSLPAAKATTSAATDSAALVALYHATQGDNWDINTNWLSSAPLDSWAGVDTDSQGRVETLWMTGNRLRGTIPAQLGRMDKLKWLRLNLNELTGPIPASLGNLTNLISLLLSNNKLTGTVPDSLGNLSSLIILSMHNNRLTGSIPASLGNLPKLRDVSVRGNRFTGCLPVGWTNLLDANTDLDESGLDFCSQDSRVLEGGDPKDAFNIELRFVEDIPVVYQNQLRRAATRFERVIVSDLPDIDFKTWPVNEYSYHLRTRVLVNQLVDDLLVLVGTRDEPGAGVAAAGVLRIRFRGKLPVVATLTMDLDALSDNAPEDVYSTMLHELGHCLGFGLVWEQLGLIKGYRTPYFTGPLARVLFAGLGGDKFRGLAVPVDGGDRGHWSGPVFWDELMAKGWYYPFNQPLSAITIAQFADLGYQVNFEEADVYTVRGRGAAKPSPADSKMHHDLFEGAVKEVDEDGRVVR